MFLRKSKGPRVITLPDGSRLSRADLPEGGTTRWVARRKAVVAKAVRFGLIDEDEALALYELSAQELRGWIESLERSGTKGLKTARLRAQRTCASPAAPFGMSGTAE